MTNTIKNIPDLLASGEIANAIEQLQSALALSDSELVNDMVLISARYRKYLSDQRRGILSYQQETLAYNRIINDVLSLVKAIEDDPEILRGFSNLEHEFETAMRERLEQCLRQVTSFKHKIVMDEQATDILFRRMSEHKKNQRTFKLLWVDDHPATIGNEIELLAAIGAQIDHTATSEQALMFAQKEEYAVILSDLVRQGDNTAGVRMLEELKELGQHRSLIFYSQNIDWSRGTPPFAFGLAALPSELLHLVMDILERKY